jgi:hypothetical protein
MRRILLCFAVAAIGSESLRSAIAQTVQLPTFNSFSVGTSVLVPDHGTAGAGGVRRTGSAWRGYGPLPGGSATGGMTSAAGARASVVIHDMQALDDRLLAGSNGVAAPAERAVRPNELLAGSFKSVAEIRRLKAAQAQAQKPKALARAGTKKAVSGKMRN